MDAAQKLLKNIAILTATVLLLSTAGLAAVPTLVLSATSAPAAGGSIGVTSSLSPGTEITFNEATAYTAGDPAWLFRINGATTTATTLTFQAIIPAGLTAALHTATVTLNPTSPSGVSPVTFTVTFDTSAGSGGGGGGSTSLTASLNPVPLNAGGNTSATNSVTITTSSATDIHIQNPVTVATTSGGNWLFATMGPYTVNSGNSAYLQISASTSGLSAGSYQGSITLVPDSGTNLVITVNFTVGGGSGSGNWSVNPLTVPWNFTTNSGSFPIQPVQVSTSSGSTSYGITTSSSNGWLLANVGGGDSFNIQGIPIGTQVYLKVGSQANNLTAGQYTGQAIITDPFGTQQATVNVTLTVNGGSSAGLTINPTSVSFNSAVNGAQQSNVVNVTSSTGGTLTVSGCNSLGWLTCALPSNTTLSPYVGAGFSVYANPAGLAANTYNATLQIQVGSQSGTLNVSLAVGSGGGGTTGTITVAPASLTFTYEAGTNTAFVARQKLVITGQAGAWSSTISSDSATWLKLSPGAGGALPDPTVDSQAPIVSVDPTGMTAGTYFGTITITTQGGSQVLQVSLNVYTTVILLPTPGSLIFAAQTGQAKPTGQAVYFSGSDGTLNPLAITAVANNSWITITTGGTYVSVNVDQTSLTTGVYSGSISVSQAGATNSPVTVPVVLVVNGGGGTTGTLSFSPSSLSFTSTNGVVSPSSTVLNVSANATTSFSTTISYTNGLNWLTVSPSYGNTNANLSVSVSSPPQVNGTYNATISFNASGAIQTVGVTLTVSGAGGGTGNVSVSPTTLAFTTLQGSNPANQTLSVTSASGSAGVAFTVTSTTTGGGLWLSTNPTNGTTPSSLTVSVNSSGMAAGSYYGNVIISPNGGTLFSIPVSLTITTPATVTAAPTALTFTYLLSGSTPAAQTISVSGGGSALAYTVTPTSTGNWLVATPASGNTPGTVTVSVNTANITATGALNGTILIAGSGGASGSTTVNVTLNVTAPLPTLTRVTNAASYAAGSIAPGEIITLFAADPTHPIGPATAVTLALDANGNVATTIGGVQVTVNNYLCPMIYASATQVSAVVPYEVMIFPSASVLVKFLGQSSNGIPVTVATTVPGLFTVNASGTGPGAILNSNSSPNSPANPAARGDVVVVYMTGEGATSPAGVTGKVTTIASPPLPLTPAPLLPVSVTVGGQPTTWFFAGEAPGFVSGVMQLNLVVPTNIQVGEQPIVVTIGGNPSQSGVTVSVK